MHVRSNAHMIGQAKSSIPALSYFQVGGMKHDQGLYAKVSYISSVGALCEGSSMRYAKGALCGSIVHQADNQQRKDLRG